MRRLILKPTALGGILPALELARRARAAGLQCVVTSSLESACGLFAAAHLAAALDAEESAAGRSPLAQGLATAVWFADNTGPAPHRVEGGLHLPDTPGLGFIPHLRG